MMNDGGYISVHASGGTGVNDDEKYDLSGDLLAKQHSAPYAFKHQFKGLLVKQRVKIGLNS